MVIVIWWVVYAIVAIALAAAAYLLTPGIKLPKEGDQKLDIPVVKEGKYIGLLYGTELIKDLNVVNWWGLKIITESKKGGKKQ